jgi:HTH-type transcriptional regulator, transcriptional repressor of NAD biosynthesis genes
MTTGFLLGKFLPPHRGHQFLCDFASTYVDDLTILVCSLPDDSIAGALRAAWMAEMYPACRIVHHDKIVPQAPEDSPDFWPIWQAICQSAHPEKIDYVFASESYGKQLAEVLNATFVPVDPDRIAVPMAGSVASADIYQHWDFLTRPVQKHFALNVALHGPESVGKSRLATYLSQHYRTIIVPEYGRTYTEMFGAECTIDDLRRIARGHAAATQAARVQANRILVSDTDQVMTAVWSHMLLGHCPDDLAHVKIPADLYLLLDVDVPWVNDGIRYFGDDATRQKFFNLCEAALKSRQLPYVRISGDWARREQSAVTAIDSLLATASGRPPIDRRA